MFLSFRSQNIVNNVILENHIQIDVGNRDKVEDGKMLQRILSPAPSCHSCDKYWPVSHRWKWKIDESISIGVRLPIRFGHRRIVKTKTRRFFRPSDFNWMEMNGMCGAMDGRPLRYIMVRDDLNNFRVCLLLFLSRKTKQITFFLLVDDDKRKNEVKIE